MTDTDTFIREAIQAKVQNDIEDKVYDRIKGELRTWKVLGLNGSVVGGALIALLLAFHSQIFSFIVDNGGDSFRKSIKDAIEGDQQALTQAKADVKAQIGTAHEELSRLSVTTAKQLDAVQTLSNEIQQRIDNLNEANKRLDALVKQQKDAEDSIKLNQDRVAAALSQLSQANSAVERLSSLYTEITQQLKDTKALPSSVPTGEQITAVYASPRARSTVYFQFAGFKREDAAKISDAIAQKGWQIPGLERTPGAVNTNQIRFNPKDSATADLLKKDADAALAALGYENISLTLQPNESVKAGIPEIWIYLP